MQTRRHGEEPGRATAGPVRPTNDGPGGGAAMRSRSACGIERGGVTPADGAVASGGPYLALCAEIGQVDAEPADPGRQLAIDDLNVRAGEACRKSTPRLCCRLMDSGFGHSAARGRAAAETSNPSQKEDAKRRQQGCFQADRTAGSRRLEAGPVLDPSVAAGRVRGDGAHGHDEASFLLSKMDSLAEGAPSLAFGLHGVFRNPMFQCDLSKEAFAYQLFRAGESASVN